MDLIGLILTLAQSEEFMAKKSKGTAFLLCIFLGLIGAHWYYLGKIGKGLLYTFTVGLFGFGWLKDIFTIGKTVDRINASNRLDDIIDLAKGGS